MRKIMKCEGFELIWNTLSLSKLKEITRSRFTWRVGTEKRSRTPLFLYNFQHDTPLRIDCISNMLNLHFLPTGKNIVHKSSICPPTWLPFLKLCIQSSLQVFPCMVNGLIQFTWQSGLFTGNPPSSSSSSPVNSTISVRSFTFPAPGQTSMPNFPHAAFTHSNRIFSKKMWIHLSGAFCHCLRKLFSRQLLELWVQILLLQPLQLLGHSPFPIQDGILALLKGPIFSFASAHNVNELHAHSMILQQMLVAQSQTITWSRWQYTLIENFEYTCKTYRTVVGVSDLLLSDPLIEL